MSSHIRSHTGWTVALLFIASCGDDAARATISVDPLPMEVDHIFACSKGADGKYRFKEMSRAESWDLA